MLSEQGRDVLGPSRTAAEAASLELLRRDDVNLVSWPRQLPPGLEAPFEEWARCFPAHFDEVVALPHYDLSSATHGLVEPVRSWLTLDIAMLLARFAHLADARHLRVSFGAIRADHCRKFHVDYLRYRLVTTYVGPGTEWVPNEAVSRAALEHPANCPCDANKEVVRDAAAIRHARPGEVLVMKGALFPGQHGAVHRSPPIEGTGRVRIVLIASTVNGS